MAGKPRRRTEGDQEGGQIPAHQLSVRLRGDLFVRARNAAAALSNPPFTVSIASIVEQGLEIALERLEKEHNRGQPFQAPKAGPIPELRP